MPNLDEMHCEVITQQ